MECIEFVYEKKFTDDFVNLYHKLYNRHDDMQNDSELRTLLNGTHSLSSYFTLSKFCIYNDNVIVGRFVITKYPQDDTAYLGFFECINDASVARFIFENATSFAIKNGFCRITGPVDASFWIRYRLKLNLFDIRPYTGEPYNKDYYQKMFEDNGFVMIKHYTSSIFDTIESTFINNKCKKRLIDFISKGYSIESPSITQWDQIIEDIYQLITHLYSDFPIYKDISYEDFAKNFASYKLIVNMEMVKIAYFQDKAVGFFISVPNYNNLVYHTNNPLNILKIMKRKKAPTEYVMLYMGVEPEHRGLGSALVQSIIDALSGTNLRSIGALQMDGKVSQHYVDEKVQQRYEYGLYSKEISYEHSTNLLHS